MFDKPTLVTMISYSLRVPTLKLRCLAADILAAMCLISALGHQLVLDGFLDARIAQNETFRFEWLISSLEAFADTREGGDMEEESAVWEWRTAALGLVNAVTASGVDLEMRCDLRGEMKRRGFDHAVDVRINVSCQGGADEKELLHREPTDTFMVQAEVYVEDQDKDLQELKQLNQIETIPVASSDDGDESSGEEVSGGELEKHGESHLAAIYEEVADLRSQVCPRLHHCR